MILPKTFLSQSKLHKILLTYCSFRNVENIFLKTSFPRVHKTISVPIAPINQHYMYK